MQNGWWYANTFVIKSKAIQNSFFSFFSEKINLTFDRSGMGCKQRISGVENKSRHVESENRLI